LETLWAFLSNPDNQQTLAWLGGGLVVAAGGLWAAVKFFLPRSSGSNTPPSPTFSADRGGIAAAGSVAIDRRKGLSGLQTILLVAVVAGALLLAAAFAGTRSTVTNGVGVGGGIEGSTITIQGGSAGAPQ
jgi:hypothetical protein